MSKTEGGGGEGSGSEKSRAGRPRTLSLLVVWSEDVVAGITRVLLSICGEEEDS